MRIIVIGGGVIGVTSAYWLRLAGHEVVLIEQDVEAGRGVSAGNGGSSPTPMSSRSPAPIVDQVPVDPARPRQRGAHAAGPVRGLDPLGLVVPAPLCRARQSESLKGLLMLAAESHRALAELLSDVPLRFDYAAAGKLILDRDAKALDGAGRLAEIKRQYGFRIENPGPHTLPCARSRAGGATATRSPAVSMRRRTRPAIAPSSPARCSSTCATRWAWRRTAPRASRISRPWAAVSSASSSRHRGGTGRRRGAGERHRCASAWPPPSGCGCRSSR